MKLIAAIVATCLTWTVAGAAEPGGGPTDPQIAAIVVTANQVDIDAGKLAMSKAQSDDVKAFAQLMITDHTAVNKAATGALLLGRPYLALYQPKVGKAKAFASIGALHVPFDEVQIESIRSPCQAFVCFSDMT